MTNDANDHRPRPVDESSTGDDPTPSESRGDDDATSRGTGPDTSAEASAPTQPRAVVQGEPSTLPSERPDMVWSAPSQTPVVRSEEPDGAERPENPFAPRPAQPSKKPRLPRRRGSGHDEGPTGKRTAEKATRRGLLAPDRTERAPLGRRNLAALTIAGISALCVIAVVVSYALWALNRDSNVAGPPAPELSATPGPILGGPQMLSAEIAKSIDPERTWQQNLDQDGVNDASPQISCIGPQATDQPNPLITRLRGISADGDDRTATLHRADAFATVEEAEKVFDFRSSELGACTDTALYVEKGMDVTGVGDEALGVRLVLQDTKSEYHSVVLARTGRVVNLLDTARVGQPADMEASVKALSQSINRQCGPAVGLCTAPKTSVTLGVPPAGGEQPGLLTAGDIPRVTLGQGTWRGGAPVKRIDIQDGSSCEAIDFATVGGSGVDRTQRTYLLRNDPAAPPQFGIDQVVLKLGSAAEAAELVERTSRNIAGCATRTLTSQVVKQAELRTPGQGGVEVKGNWYIVTQKVDQAQTQKYRVGVFSAGDRMVYLRSNPTDRFDFSDDAWIGVNLRAGERITQVQ